MVVAVVASTCRVMFRLMLVMVGGRVRLLLLLLLPRMRTLNLLLPRARMRGLLLLRKL